MATKWIGISVPIYAGMVHWPVDQPIEISHPLPSRPRRHLHGFACTVSRLALGAHTNARFRDGLRSGRGTFGASVAEIRRFAAQG